jgi:hypothetical protein
MPHSQTGIRRPAKALATIANRGLEGSNRVRNDGGRNSSRIPERRDPAKRNGSPSSRILRNEYWKSGRLNWNHGTGGTWLT